MKTSYKDYRILIADDHDLILDGIRRILEQAFSFKETATFTEAATVLEAIEEETYDLYILDLEFKDFSGFELIKVIRKKQPAARIIVSSMHEELWTVNRLLEADVNGIVLKSSASEHIVRAVHNVLSGENYFCPHFSVFKHRNGWKYEDNKRKNCLPTPQEKLVLQHIAKGYTTQEISDMLSLSDNTIESHRRSLLVKFNARNVAQLVSIAISTGIIHEKL